MSDEHDAASAYLSLRRLRRRLLFEDRQHWRMPLLWWKAGRDARKLEDILQQVEIYAMFLGYPRSGHTLIASLLNAHPDMVIAHELNALRYVQWRFSRDRIFALLLRRDRDFARIGRHWSGYDYSVPGLWQGTWRHLRVIGDKRGGASTRLLHRRPYLLDRLRSRVGLPLRVFHHVRNPFDNIARMALVSGASLPHAVERYFRNVSWAMETIDRLDPFELMHVYHERMIEDPREILRAMVAHVGLDADEQYLNICTGRVLRSPRLTRDRVDWPSGLVQEVERRMESHPHLAGYGFDT